MIWNYKVEQLKGTDKLAERQLNGLGQQGWELVCVLPENLHAIFKRPEHPDDRVDRAEDGGG